MGWVGGEGVWRWGKREVIYHHQTDSCIKMGRDESHFNVSLIVRDKVTRQCPQTTIFEEKGEPKRIRTEVLLLTSLTPYRGAKPTHNLRGCMGGCLMCGWVGWRGVLWVNGWVCGTSSSATGTCFCKPGFFIATGRCAGSECRTILQGCIWIVYGWVRLRLGKWGRFWLHQLLQAGLLHHPGPLHRK